MARYLLLVVLVMGVSVWMMEAKALPAKRRPSSSLSAGMRSLFSSFSQDEMMPAVPAMMMMPSFVYYHVVSPNHSPFHPMSKSMFGSWAARFAVESSSSSEEEIEEEEAEESKKIEEISKSDKEEEGETKEQVEESAVNKTASIAEEEEEEEEEKQTENEQVTEIVTEETNSFDGNEDEVLTTTEILNTDSPISPQTTDEENSTTTTTEIQQAEEDSIIVEVLEDKLLIKPSDNSTVKTPARPSSTTYVCKFGKCQHTMEAKKLLEQEIEAELWAKL